MNEEQELNQCTCEHIHDDHPCPYHDELGNGEPFECDCCPYCTMQCAHDI